jgi:dUTP pyrophosphatase
MSIKESSTPPPSYILKMFIMKKSSCLKTDSNSNQNYEEIVKAYNEKVKAHNKKVRESQYADSGFDLIIPFDYSEHDNGYTDNRITNVTFRAPLSVKCSMLRVNSTRHIIVPCGYYLYPRSSIVKTPFRLSNSVGIIDSGYRGEIMAVVDNIDSENNDMKACILKYMSPMTRMFQICSPTLEPFLVEIVESEEELGFTERGTGGFGSTGL